MVNVAREISLDREPIETAIVGTIEGYRLQVMATCIGIPNQIFVYQVQMLDPFTRQQAAEFFHVATPADLEELPINGVTEDSPLLFRLRTLDVVFRDLDMLERGWENLQEDINLLVVSLNKLDNPSVEELVTIGDFSECEGSSSSSSSEGSSSSE